MATSNPTFKTMALPTMSAYFNNSSATVDAVMTADL